MTVGPGSTGNPTGPLLADLADRARQALPRPVFDYFAQGARDGLTAAEAERAWDRFRVLPRVLMDVTDVQVGTTLLGAEVSSPFAIAPTTLQRAAHRDGELAMARAAARAGSLLVVSSNAGTVFAEIGAAGAPWWLQMYVTADRAVTAPVVQGALDAGARAIVLTVDTPVVGTKHQVPPTVWDSVDPGWLRVNFPEPPPGTAPTAFDKARDLGPQDIAWLARRFEVPVVVKGILDPRDARRAVDAGAAAVWVSNHGGRQLDGVVSTADAVGAVVEEVGGDTEVYVDGGVRRGRHALVASALGARGVFLGRPALFALAADGDDGVVTLLGALTDELVECLRLSGFTRPEDVPRSLVEGCERAHVRGI